MNRQALADRIISYSDTLVAFAIVNGFAFVISLGEPDIRCSIANVSGVAFAINLIAPLVSTYGLVWLRRYEHRLRCDDAGDTAAATDTGVTNDSADRCAVSDSAAAIAIVDDELVSRFWRIAFALRVGLIWLFASIVILGIYGATLDSRCVASVG